MSYTLKIYHNLSPALRSVAASLNGYYLRSWRYDSQTEKLVEEILERDYWDERQWKKWQEERLAFVLHRAATKVPYYKNEWAERRRSGDNSSWDYLENWSILEKQTLRAKAIEFVAEDCRISKMYRDHTSGTTGTSLNLWLTGQTVKHWYAMFEARWRRWYKISRHDRWAILGGQLIAPVAQTKPPFWVWNAGLNQLYMSSYHLSPKLIGYYLDALIKYRVKYVWGYSSALYSLAQEILNRERRDIKMEVVVTNAEPLFEYQRETIAAAFNCPVRETYGMAEMVAAAGECEHNNLHQWLDAGIITTNPPPEQPNQFADFICTGLINSDMPLIRYRVGDCGTLSDEKCVCGKTLPLIGKIEGRSDDTLYTIDGRRVGRLDPVFKNDLPIIEAQIVQKSLRNILVNYVPAKNFTRQTEQILTERLRERMGEIEVKFEEMAAIPRTNNGKFRAVICELSIEDLAVFNRSKNQDK